MSNYPCGVYNCGRCGCVAGPGHECNENPENYEIYYSKNHGEKWYLCEERSDREKALRTAGELVDDGFDSRVIDNWGEIIFSSLEDKKEAV